MTGIRRRGHTGDHARVPLLRVSGRHDVTGPNRRTAPQMRFDLLQVIAWCSGLTQVVIGLVALARAGFDQISLRDPVVEVVGLASTPLLALLMLSFGIVLLAAATGEVDDRVLRLLGVALGVVGTVWFIEPDAFQPLLGIERANGGAALTVAVVIVLSSFVPPLALRRPGARGETFVP